MSYSSEGLLHEGSDKRILMIKLIFLRLKFLKENNNDCRIIDRII